MINPGACQQVPHHLNPHAPHSIMVLHPPLHYLLHQRGGRPPCLNLSIIWEQTSQKRQWLAVGQELICLSKSCMTFNLYQGQGHSLIASPLLLNQLKNVYQIKGLPKLIWSKDLKEQSHSLMRRHYWRILPEPTFPLKKVPARFIAVRNHCDDEY